MLIFETEFGKGPMAYIRNCFDLNPDAGLFINTSRLNHSCLLNCDRHYVHHHGLMVISAGKDIPCGDELTIRYS